MKCKYCEAELESNSSVCPKCGKDNLKDSLLPLKIVALSLTCVVMLVLLAGMVHYGVTGSFLPNWGKTSQDPTGSSTSSGTGTVAEDSYQVITVDGTVTVDNATLQDFMNQVVATIGENELTNRQLQLYYWMAVYTYADENTDLDLTADLDTVVYDETTGESVQDHCLTMAFDAWQEITLLANAARSAGYEMPEDYAEDLEGLEAQLEQYVYMYSVYYGYDISSVDELIQMQFGAGCNFATYYNYCWEYYLGGTYWSEMVLSLEVTEDQINDYFSENAEDLKNNLGIDKDFGNMADFRNILIKVGSTTVENEDGSTTTTITDENWEECLQKAQALYDSWLAAGGTEEGFIALIPDNSEDTTSKNYGGLYEDQYWGLMSTVDVRHILIFPEGATSSTVTSQEWSDEAWAYAQTKAQEILDQYLAGEMTAEAFGELAVANSADGNASSGGLYEGVVYGYMVETFNDWCFDRSRQPGDTGIVKTEFGYHVMYFVQRSSDLDDWLFAEDRVVGDCAIIKSSDGYEILYASAIEPAWYRYSRYGVQGKIGEEMLNELVEANPYTVDYSKIALTTSG